MSFTYSEYKQDDNGNYLLSKDDAKEVRDVYARGRDFWLYDMEANKKLMQAALDVLNNSIEGNDYYVDYMDSQNGCRLCVICSPCNSTLTSYDPFMSHDNGKNHKKITQHKVNQKEKEKFANVELSYRPLNVSKGVYDTNSLEDMLDYCEERVLGMQFVYKQRLEGKNSSFAFSCQLCQKDKISKHQMFDHITKDTQHNRTYMELKFGFPRIVSTEIYEKRCRDVELLEGRMNHSIVDFTSQYQQLKKFQGGESPTTHFSPPPSPGRGSPGTSPRRTSPLPPLTQETGVQVNTDELDDELPLHKEIALIKLNDGQQLLQQDDDAIELMLETLQTLNQKMFTFYQTRSRKVTLSTCKYQNYITECHSILKQIKGDEETKEQIKQ